MEGSSAVANLGGVEPLTQEKMNPVFHSLIYFAGWNGVFYSYERQKMNFTTIIKINTDIASVQRKYKAHISQVYGTNTMFRSPCNIGSKTLSSLLKHLTQKPIGNEWRVRLAYI